MHRFGILIIIQTIFMPSTSGASNCNYDQYRCCNGKCITYSYKTDNDNDCGDYSDLRGCHNTNGQWNSWSSYTSCNVNCGGGYKTKYRSCNNPLPSCGGNYCYGNSFAVTRCNTQVCPVNGGWNSWTGWGSCSVTCGSGHQTRTRKCNNPTPSSNGQYCSGDAHETKNCLKSECRVNGGWNTWTGWGSCSVTCGSGHQTRTRKCNTPSPSSNGQYCSGDAHETKNCLKSECQVNGGWNSWTGWGSCSVTCGSGHQTRTRKCNNPSPSPNGQYCNGDAHQVKNCLKSECQVNGGWNSWTGWGSCSVTCGSGHQIRTRKCNTPSPSSNGQYCTGDAHQVKNCLKSECQVNGNWNSWSDWGDCSVSCGTGYQSRTRKCNRPAPSSTGEYCAGTGHETKRCTIMKECQVPGSWGSWSHWGMCNVTCGAGNQTRTRSCENPRYSWTRYYCSRESSEIQSCSLQDCLEPEGLQSTFSHGGVGLACLCVGCVLCFGILKFRTKFKKTGLDITDPAGSHVYNEYTQDLHARDPVQQIPQAQETYENCVLASASQLADKHSPGSGKQSVPPKSSRGAKECNQPVSEEPSECYENFNFNTGSKAKITKTSAAASGQTSASSTAEILSSVKGQNLPCLPSTGEGKRHRRLDYENTIL